MCPEPDCKRIRVSVYSNVCSMHKIEDEHSSTGFHIDLDDYPEILAGLKEQAKKDIRSIPHEIVFILQTYLAWAEAPEEGSDEND